MQPFQRLFSFFSSVRGSVSKNCSVTPILPFLFLLGSLAWVSPAGFAASFDCTKAGTAIEKMICADPAISKLDEDLAAAYRDALATAPDQDALRRQQREWITQVRDRCRDPASLKAAYEQRLAQVQAPSAKQPLIAEVAKERRYPPYPEVWGSDFGDLGSGQNPILGVWHSSNGDIVVRFELPGTSVSESTNRPGECGLAQYAYRELFAQKEHRITCDEFNHFAERFDIRPVERAKHIGATMNFSDNSTIRYWGARSSGCGEPFPAYYEIADPSGKVILRKSIFVRLPKPESMGCRVEPDLFTISIDTEARPVVLLKDDTFLLVGVADRYVLRFDKNFNTRFPYDRKNIFIVDTSAVDAARKRAKERCPADPLGCMDAEMWKHLNALNP